MTQEFKVIRHLQNVDLCGSRKADLEQGLFIELGSRLLKWCRGHKPRGGQSRTLGLQGEESDTSLVQNRHRGAVRGECDIDHGRLDFELTHCHWRRDIGSPERRELDGSAIYHGDRAMVVRAARRTSGNRKSILVHNHLA